MYIPIHIEPNTSIVDEILSRRLPVGLLERLDQVNWGLLSTVPELPALIPGYTKYGLAKLQLIKNTCE